MGADVAFYLTNEFSESGREKLVDADDEDATKDVPAGTNPAAKHRGPR